MSVRPVFSIFRALRGILPDHTVLSALFGTDMGPGTALILSVLGILNLLSESLPVPMPLRSVVHCSGCTKTFTSEAGLRRHYGQSGRFGSACHLEAGYAPRISVWAPGGAAPAGRVSVVDMGPGLYDSDRASPDPGDDLGDPPSDFDENDLGGPVPPPPPPPPPVPQVRLSFSIGVRAARAYAV